MRLGLIGPCKGDTATLRKRAALLLDTHRANRVVYLGIDGALDAAVHSWAHELVDGDPSDDAVWSRAAQQCAQASVETIEAFLALERRRACLKLLECLPYAEARTLEFFKGVVSVIIYDKALLDEEDMLPASILVFGRHHEPMIHRIGPWTFVCPGPAGHPRGGAALLTDEGPEVMVSFFNSDGETVERQPVARFRGPRVIVRGASVS